MESEQKEKIGLIAGEGRFPFLVAEGAKKAGLAVVTLGLRGSADPELGKISDRFYWAPLARPGKWIRIFRRENVSRAILAGRVRKIKMVLPIPLLLLRYLPDWRALRIYFGRLGKTDRRNRTLLTALADELEREGVNLENSVKYCKEHLACEGAMGKHLPTDEENKDVEFGWQIAKEIARLDVGQSLAVKSLDVIAVEAIEGTDAMIERAGRLCKGGGWVLVKVAQKDQDMRFDVPTIGPTTIRKLAESGCSVLVVEAGKTLIIDKPETLALADKLKVAVVGKSAPE
jgi:DUF1009 family protein